MRILCSKVGMTSIFTESGQATGVTVLKLMKGKVVRLEVAGQKNLAIVEFETGNKKSLTRGFEIAKDSAISVGSEVPVPEFSKGQLLKITGVTKGKGFQDAVTRHGFAGGPASHGSRFHRAPGSVGMRTEPGRTPKGKKLPGHMGSKVVTLKNVEVVFYSAEEGVIAVKGGVPGSTGGLLFV